MKAFIETIVPSSGLKLLSRPAILTNDNLAAEIHSEGSDDQGFMKLNVTVAKAVFQIVSS